jgi:hypothetical protein
LLTEIQRQKPFLEHVDLFAGTSTGGILALGLAMGLSPDRLMRLYTQRGHQIFGNRDLLDTVLFGADEVYRADYGTEAIKKVLSDEFGGTKVTLPRPFPLDAAGSVPALLDLVNGEEVKRKLAAAIAFA